MNTIELKNLNIRDTRNGERIVRDLSFSLPEHSCLALVGESGSGKSMTAKAVNGIHKPWIACDGQVLFEGEDLLRQTQQRVRELRGKKIFMIFQDGMSAFDPSCTIRASFREILLANLGGTRADADRRIEEALQKVLMSSGGDVLDKYPHQLSGGMLQRVMIAISLALEPALIIADEPTTSLDTITQYEVVCEFQRLRREYGTTMIFISHDLGVVRKLADCVVVMRKGEKVEEGPTEEVFLHPQNEYTRYLVETRMALGENYKKLIREKRYA